MRYILVLVTFTLILSNTQTAESAQPAASLFVLSDKCLACHNGLITSAGQDVSIGSNWQSSMMAHAAKDPYWQASVRRESLDHPQVKKHIEDECSACHMPMSRYTAKTRGSLGEVFAHLPLLQAGGQTSLLAKDGVSCSMCHQIQADHLGSEASFTAGFVVNTTGAPGKRPAFGPYTVDEGRTRVMRSATQLVPNKSEHVQDSSLCGSCHTLYTQARGPDGEITGELPEQVPYLEWRHSAFYQSRSCQSCHMPQLDHPMNISAVLGQPRQNFSRHVFRGGNFLMPRIFNANRAELGVTVPSQDLILAAQETLKNLTDDAAGVEIHEVERTEEGLVIRVRITNMTGHKLPTAYPSRRTWLHLEVTDADGEAIFSSGLPNKDGSIQGNDNDRDPGTFEPHYTTIYSADQVQIYEPILVDAQGNVTTGLLSAVGYIKDNRILPMGFDKDTAEKDIAVYGRARNDADFVGGEDLIDYRIQENGINGPYTITAELYYQPIGFRWARNLRQQQAAEIERFVSYYDAFSEHSAIVMTSDRIQTP